jgi:hypothetical protein
MSDILLVQPICSSLLLFMMGVVISFELVEAFQFDRCCIMWRKEKLEFVSRLIC